VLIDLTTLYVAATIVDQKMTLMRRTVSEQCNFTFPRDDVSEYEANPDIVRNYTQKIIGTKLTYGYRQESG
jgi:hypothetical protein